jgi:hypothetical protein
VRAEHPPCLEQRKLDEPVRDVFEEIARRHEPEATRAFA